jgi:hypothetical protein
MCEHSKKKLLQSGKCVLYQEHCRNDHQTDEQVRKENGAHHLPL